MPNIQPIRYDASEELVEYCSLETAVQCLEEYCQEEEIDLSRIPKYSIDLFLATCQYAPFDIDLERIAIDCGITVENYSTDTPIPTRFVDPEQIRQIGTRVSNISNSNRLSNSISWNESDFAEYLQLSADIARPEQVTLYETLSDAMAQPTPTPQPMLVSQRVRDMISDMYVTSMPTSKKKVVKKRSEHDMFMEIVRSENFPRPMFREWSDNSEMNDIINDWFRNVEYREQWIFSRREREGFNRRNIGNFNLDDVMARISKRKNKHSMDTENSTFYDWKLGGTDWTLRLELYHHEGRYFLITRHIYKPANIEIKYDVRYWNGNTFKHVGTMFTEQCSIDENFERVFGTNNPNIEWHGEDESCDEEYEPDFEDSNPW